MDKAELLINAWVRLSFSLKNESLVDSLTFNETVLCGHIYRSNNEIQFKTLSSNMNISKSLLARSINKLEKQGLLKRIKKRGNQKNVYLSLSDLGIKRYLKEHEHALTIAKRVEEIMNGNIDTAIDIFNNISDSIDRILSEEKDND